jgi:hypothetical protein
VASHGRILQTRGISYNRAILQRYLEVYSAYCNFCLSGKDKKTSAMSLGLAKAPVDPNTVLHFT